MKITKAKLAKLFLRIGTGAGALLLGAVPAYLITPARVSIVDLSESANSSSDGSSSNFSGFVTKYTQMLDNGLSGIDLGFENFQVSFPGQKNRNNLIKITNDSELQLIIRNLNDIELKADLTVDYNNRQVPIALAYTDHTAYLRLYDFGVKMNQASGDDLFTLLQDTFGDPNGLNIDVLGTIKKTADKFTSFLSSIGTTLTAQKEDETSEVVPAAGPEIETGIKFGTLPDVPLTDGGFIFRFEISNTYKVVDVEDDPLTPDVNEEVAHGETDYMGIHIYTKANYDITKIDLCPEGSVTDDNNVVHPYHNGLKFGDIEIKGVINANIAPLTITAPAETTTFHYIEIANYYGWVRRLSDLLADNNRKMGFDFSARLSMDKETEDETTHVKTKETVQLGGLKGSIDLDASALINLDPFTVGYVDDGLDHSLPDGHLAIENETIRKLLNAVKLGMNFQLFSHDDDWDLDYGSSNLSIKYANEAGYLTLNEFEDSNTHDVSHVLKAKVDTNTINWLIKELPSAINDIKGEIENIIARFIDKTYVPGDIDEEAKGLFDFITSSDLVTAIKEGEYAPILDLITRFSNNATLGVINLDLSLKPLGFGNNATISLVLDSRYPEPGQPDEYTVLHLDARNIELGSIKLDFDLDSVDGREIVVGEESDYDSMTFLPTVVDQVAGILGDREVAFDVDATIYDENDLGIKLYGDAQFNYNSDLEADYTNKGYGQLTIEQYEYHKEGELDSNSQVIKPWATHKVAIDVDNHSDEPSGNNVKFIYGDPDDDNNNIKGYFTMQTIYDVVKSIKTVMRDEDPRYAFFTDLFAGAATTGTISDIINDNDYLRLARNDFIKEIKQYDGGLTLSVVLGGTLLGLDSDIKVNIGFKSVDHEYGDRELSYIELEDFVMGEGEDAKTINAKITLKTFDPNYDSPIHAGLDGYLDLTSIKLLLDFGINTTKINYYHLTGTINLNALSFVNVELTVNMWLHITGRHTEIYGKIEFGVSKIVTWGANIGGSAGGVGDVFKHGNLVGVTTEFTFKPMEKTDENYVNENSCYMDIYKDVDNRFIVHWHDYYHYRTTNANLLAEGNLITYLMDDMLDINGSMIGNVSVSSGDEEKKPGDYTHIFSDKIY